MKILAGAHGDAEERFSVIGFAILPEDFKQFQKRFTLQIVLFFSCQVRDLIQDHHKRIGDERIRRLVSDTHVVAIFAGEVVAAFECVNQLALTGSFTERYSHPSYGVGARRHLPPIALMRSRPSPAPLLISRSLVTRLMSL